MDLVPVRILVSMYMPMFELVNVVVEDWMDVPLDKRVAMDYMSSTIHLPTVR
ncbi:MAG: hypothetical protein HW407_1093 [Bacteroidetes bacterium]|nr:hypothetical protein [Bacteroidota bacterium]